MTGARLLLTNAVLHGFSAWSVILLFPIWNVLENSWLVRSDMWVSRSVRQRRTPGPGVGETRQMLLYSYDTRRCCRFKGWRSRRQVKATPRCASLFSRRQHVDARGMIIAEAWRSDVSLCFICWHSMKKCYAFRFMARFCMTCVCLNIGCKWRLAFLRLMCWWWLYSCGKWAALHATVLEL